MTEIYENIRIEARGAAIWLVIDRPASRNALSRATLAEIGTACAALADRADVRALVVSGAGTEAFAAGGDLKELGALRDREATGEFFDFASSMLDGLRRFPLPTVAALNGWALGGGAELAFACDFRVASAGARIGFVQATLAITSGFGGGTDLMRVLGPSAGLRQGLLATPLDATAALAAGLVDDVAPPGADLAATVDVFLGRMLRHPPQVLRAYKSISLAARDGLDGATRRAVEREGFVRTWTHADHWAAVEALRARAKEK